MDNNIQYYIQYISSWFYHNVLYTETTSVLLKLIVFIVLLTLLVYQKYHYFAVGIVVVICVLVILFLRTSSPAAFAFATTTSMGRCVDKDELTTGVPLIKEGFGIAMPKIIQGDDSGKDYRRSNKFVEEDSRDFTDKYFNSKKCGIGSGIGGITMFGSNELIGGERKAVLSGLYNFDEYYVSNNTNTELIGYTVGSCDSKCKEARRWRYFNDCVFDPIKRNDFRSLKTLIYDNVNNNIMNINGILQRVDTTILFNTQNDPSVDYSKRISLSSKQGDTELGAQAQGGINYVSLINGKTNQDKLKNIQTLSNGDNINDKQYSELLSKINNNRDMNSGDKQRHLEIYAKVYEFRKRIDSIFANMRAQTKDDASLMYTVRVGESVVQELRMMLSYLAMIQRTNDIILFEKNVGTSNNGIYNMNPTTQYLAPILPDDKESRYKSKIIGKTNNIFKIPLEDDTYNNNDEKRYLYGITYYFDKDNSNSKPIGT